MSDNSAKWSKVLELYDQGASDVEICKELGLTQAKFDRLYQDVPTFAALIDQGRTISKAWWYAMIRKGIFDKTINASIVNFAMKNLHGWADKVETTSTGEDQLSADELRAQYRSLAAALEKKEPGLVRGLVALPGGKQEKEGTND